MVLLLIGLLDNVAGAEAFERRPLALFLALGLAGYMGGPLSLAGALALAAVGWRKARGRRPGVR